MSKPHPSIHFLLFHRFYGRIICAKDEFNMIFVNSRYPKNSKILYLVDEYRETLDRKLTHPKLANTISSKSQTYLSISSIPFSKVFSSSLFARLSV